MGDAREPMSKVRETFKVSWYRCPIPTERLKELTKRSDARGAFQAVGFLLVIVTLGAVTWWLYSRSLWVWTAVALFAYGTVFSFISVPNHELCHGTVFRTRRLNTLFLWFYGIIGGTYPHHYKRSHTYHHVYTLHPRGDREVVLPATPSLHPLRLFLLLTFNWETFAKAIRMVIMLAFAGSFWDQWSEDVFENDGKARAEARRWAWILILYHAAVITVGVVFRLWMLPVLLTLGSFIANWWMYLVFMPMHTGLRDNVPDFRLCVRSITLDPFSEFLYWHMNWHTEHHMYAAVPCYRLPEFARTIAADMPKPRTLLGAWKEMRMIYKRQMADPSYQYDTPLPAGAGGRQGNRDALAASIGDLASRELG